MGRKHHNSPLDSRSDTPSRPFSDDTRHPVAVRTSQKPFKHDAQDVQKPVVMPPSPSPESALRSRPGEAVGPKVSHEEESEAHDTESIDTIKESKGDTVDAAAELVQASDDDSGNASDDEGAAVAGIAQEKDARQRQHVVDDLVKNIMSNKKDEAETEDDGTDEEGTDIPETAEAVEKAKQPLTSDPLSAADLDQEKYEFPSWEECESVKDTADTMPDILHVPFEDAVKDETLQGWEDEWVASARFRGGKLKEPKIDFVYNCTFMRIAFLLIMTDRQIGVNGSQSEFVNTMRPYELNSTLNDPEGVWLESHSSNRYREWDELRYSVRSVEKYAHKFLNGIQILVNSYKTEDGQYGKQRPHWLKEDHTKAQVLSQEEFFGREERKCLPTFDSLTIENQIFNTPSDVDRVSFFAENCL